MAKGDRSDTDRLMQIVYEDFRRLAGGYVRGPAQTGTLQPTALVHEAFLRLVDQTQVDWRDRSHFFAVGATAMRQILVDQARRTSAQKRGGDRERIELDETLALSPRSDADVLAVDEVLVKLAQINERRAKIVEMRFFAGMSVEEVAAALAVSRSTVQKQWAATSRWLRLELAAAEG